MIKKVELFSPEQVAEVFGMSHFGILRLIRNGKLRAINISSGDQPRYKLTQEHIDEFLNRPAVALSTGKPESKKPAKKRKRLDEAVPQVL